MLKELNEVRTNPSSYANKIRQFSGQVTFDENLNKSFFIVDANTKINLLAGKEAFKSCAELLSRQAPLCALELRQELKFNFPSQKPEICSSKEYITKTFMDLNNQAKGRYKIVGFHYDISVNDAILSTIIQVVDDNNSNGQRRRHILNERVKYVGINIGKVQEGIYCIYLVFAT